MNEIIDLKLQDLGNGVKYSPVFRFTENTLSIVLNVAGQKMTVDMLKYIEEISDENLDIYVEAILDVRKEVESELPDHLRSDTGFSLGEIVHIESFVHDIHLYYILELDQIALIRYQPGFKKELILYEVSYFNRICLQWLEKLKALT